MAAETTTRLMVRDISTLQFFDATGTPLTLAVRLKDGSISWTVHQPDIVETQDANGACIGPLRDGAETGRSEITLNCDIFDVGDNASDATFLDLVEQDGVVGSTWVSTTSTESGETKTFGVKMIIANRGSAGALKGATLTWAACRFVPPVTITGARDGFHASGLTIRSTQMKPTKTRTT